MQVDPALSIVVSSFGVDLYTASRRDRPASVHSLSTPTGAPAIELANGVAKKLLASEIVVRRAFNLLALTRSVSVVRQTHHLY